MLHFGGPDPTAGRFFYIPPTIRLPLPHSQLVELIAQQTESDEKEKIFRFGFSLAFSLASFDREE